jgi:very-short-patch-repair endonuclease
MHVKRNFRLLEQARALRRNMTPQETKLWYQFLRTYPVKFYKQRIIESFIADFYCASACLVIEIDGAQHYTSQGQAYDRDRCLVMQRYGIDTIRFSNADIDRNFAAVCQKIHETIQRRIE